MPPPNLYAHVQHFLPISHMRPRVRRAPGLPCALCLTRVEEKNGPTRAEHAARLRSLATMKLLPCGMTMNLFPLHELRKGLRVIRMPARQCGAIFDDVAVGPGHAAFVELPRHVVIRAEDVEIPGVDAFDHEVYGLLRCPGAIRFFAAAARGETGEYMTGDHQMRIDAA